MSEHWIWSNQQGKWLGPSRVTLVSTLRDAGRFAEGIARKIVHFGNQDLGDQDWPDLVAVEVTNDYLFPEGKRLVEDFVVTGDRGPLDEAFFAKKDRELLADPELLESLEQMRQGEGREISPDEFMARTTS